MKLTKELLSAENYTGTRRIQVKSPMIDKYKKEIDAYQKQAKPFLKKMEEISKVLDPHYAQITEHTKEINRIKAEMAGTLELYNVELKKVELLDQKAQMIKNKMQPIVDKEIAGKLEEFERPTNLTTEKGFHYVEVVDDIEEYIKAKRLRK
jgi:hypothetical protein